VLAFGMLTRYLVKICSDWAGRVDRETLAGKLRTFLDRLASGNPMDPAGSPLLKQYSIDIEPHGDGANEVSIKAGFELGFQFEDATVTFFPTVRLDAVLGSG
jgi:hypothetical protein